MKLKSTILLLALSIFTSASLWSQSYVYQEEFNSQGSWTNDNNDIKVID